MNCSNVHFSPSPLAFISPPLFHYAFNLLVTNHETCIPDCMRSEPKKMNGKNIAIQCFGYRISYAFMSLLARKFLLHIHRQIFDGRKGKKWLGCCALHGDRKSELGWRDERKCRFIVHFEACRL